MIVLKREHNHPIFSTDTLHHIAPSPETEEKQAALFCQGDSPNTPSVSSNLPSLTEEEKVKYQALLNRIQEGLSANPTLFVPAVKKMLKNADAFASTEHGLAFAMHTFGLYSGVKATTRTAAKRLVQHSHKTSPVCKKLLLSGEKKLKVCQPIIIRELLPRELSNHNYTSSGVLPKTKLNKT